jgi:hypothetical protein
MAREREFVIVNWSALQRPARARGEGETPDVVKESEYNKRPALLERRETR